jgi:signal peptidase II
MNEPAADAAPPPASPASFWRGKGIFWLPIAPLVALDLWSKVWAFAKVESEGRVVGLADGWKELPVFEGIVNFHLVTWRNTGTVWGLFQQNNAELIVLRCVALVLIVVFAWRTRVEQRMQLLALSLIQAGAIGNLYDNFTEPGGGVRDFLLFFVGSGTERTAFPAFNVADSCITVGALTFAFLLLRADFAQARAARAAKAAKAAAESKSA